MTKVNNTTKKGLNMINSYKYYLSKNKGLSLYEIYSHFSYAKEYALDYNLFF